MNIAWSKRLESSVKLMSKNFISGHDADLFNQEVKGSGPYFVIIITYIIIIAYTILLRSLHVENILQKFILKSTIVLPEDWLISFTTRNAALVISD